MSQKGKMWCLSCDRILFAVPGDPVPAWFGVVRLTWRGSPEELPLPETLVEGWRYDENFLTHVHALVRNLAARPGWLDLDPSAEGALIERRPAVDVVEVVCRVAVGGGGDLAAGAVYPGDDLADRARFQVRAAGAGPAEPAEPEEPQLPGADQVLHLGQRRGPHRTAEPAKRHGLLAGRQDEPGGLGPGGDGKQVGRAVP